MDATRPASASDGRDVRRILLGDTEAWAIEIFEQAATQVGAELHVTKNGVDAIERFKTLTPALVVLDTLLPKLDGLQAASKIREMELGRITPVVVTSALYRSEEDVERLRERHGFTGFLPKPFGLEDVVSLFEEYLKVEAEAAVPETDLLEDGLPLIQPRSAESPLVPMGVPALLCQVYRGRRSGTLTLRRGEITKVLFFERGHITHARSNSRRDRLGRILLAQRRISLEDYERARRLQTEASGRLQLGSALIQLGLLRENDVANAVSSQILNVVFSLFDWSEGSWSFLDSTSVPPEYARFSFNTPNLIFWGLRQIEGKVRFGALLPGSRLVVERPADGARLKEQLNLTFLEEQIVALVDGKKRLGEILAMGRLARVDVERVVFSLIVLGVMRAVNDGKPELPVAGQISAESAIDCKGELTRTSVVRVMSRLHLTGQTGALSFRAGTAETQVWVEDGEVVYARSNQDTHRLGNILLRLGSIAPEDHARAMSALEGGSERKIGELFLEMRAISLEELHTGLRMQVQDIVLDLFRWREGEYTFDAGTVPGDLMVSLAATTPNLILEGARASDAPPGITQLLRSSETVLLKLWGEERLGKLLQLSSAERRVLGFIEAGRAASELATLSVLTEQELARILHGLLALEVVRALKGSPRPAASKMPTIELNEEETPFPPTRALGGEAAGATPIEEVTGSFQLAQLVRDRSAAAVQKLELDNERLGTENRELRARVVRLEAQLDHLTRTFARYSDEKDGEGTGQKLIERVLGGEYTGSGPG